MYILLCMGGNVTVTDFKEARRREKATIPPSLEKLGVPHLFVSTSRTSFIDEEVKVEGLKTFREKGGCPATLVSPFP